MQSIKQLNRYDGGGSNYRYNSAALLCLTNFYKDNKHFAHKFSEWFLYNTIISKTVVVLANLRVDKYVYT